MENSFPDTAYSFSLCEHHFGWTMEDKLQIPDWPM
jgi:hypothetical protein